MRLISLIFSSFRCISSVFMVAWPFSDKSVQIPYWHLNWFLPLSLSNHRDENQSCHICRGKFWRGRKHASFFLLLVQNADSYIHHGDRNRLHYTVEINVCPFKSDVTVLKLQLDQQLTPLFTFFVSEIQDGNKVEQTTLY